MEKRIDSSMDKLIADFNLVVADSEKLIKSLGEVGSEKSGELRAAAQENLRVARQRLADLKSAALERGQAAVRGTDEYVRANPWQSLGTVAAVSALAGFVIGLLMNRR